MSFDLSDLINPLLNAAHSVGAELNSSWFYIQIGLIMASAGLASLIAVTIRSRTDRSALVMGWPTPIRLLVRALFANLATAIFTILTATIRLAMVSATLPSHSYVVSVVASLTAAWFLIRIATALIRNPLAVRLVSLSAWLVAALSILGILGPTTDALDSVAITIGGLRITPLLVIKMSALMAFALWLANVASNFIDTRVSHVNELTPSVQVLISKLVRILLMALAIVIVMSSVGIDLSALTIFSGAVGVGIGFGLQKIVANFISGVILLADKSVKPGDLVTVGDSFGRISAMNTRYISVSAGDGREFLIPNEDLVTQKVVNWTYTDKNTLVEVKFATSYEANPRHVCELAVGIAEKTPRVIAAKKPACTITEFSDYSMKFSLTFWISDPEAGMGNVRGAVMLSLWDAFKAEGINVPYPVRDIRVRGVLPVETAAPADETGQ
jgi:small-conductance mechanosensitive channel